MSTVVAPLSSVKKQQYEEKVASALKQQEEGYARRVAANREHARMATEKLLRKYKEFKAAEDAKLSNPEAFYVPAEPKFIVAIQVRSQRKIGPKPRTVLKLFRLRTINSAVILRNNKSTKSMLQRAKDYIAYGYLDYEMLRKLVYLRGHGKLGRSKVALTNENIEQAFDGKYKCIEELVHQIFFGSDDIKQILNFLWPFRLSCPLGGFQGRKKMSFLEGGATNDHKEQLGDLLGRMI